VQHKYERKGDVSSGSMPDNTLSDKNADCIETNDVSCHADYSKQLSICPHRAGSMRSKEEYICSIAQSV
jgi:hypothetical protein